jgi:hypothetical protein
MSSLPANQIEAILEVLTPGQLATLAEQLRRIKSIGYGRVTIVFQNGVTCQIQVQESFDFRDDINRLD